MIHSESHSVMKIELYSLLHSLLPRLIYSSTPSTSRSDTPSNSTSLEPSYFPNFDESEKLITVMSTKPNVATSYNSTGNLSEFP